MFGGSTADVPRVLSLRGMARNLIEIRPSRGGWEVSEMSEQLFFLTLESAITYARFRLLLRPGEIRIFDAVGVIVETIASAPEKE